MAHGVGEGQVTHFQVGMGHDLEGKTDAHDVTMHLLPFSLVVQSMVLSASLRPTWTINMSLFCMWYILLSMCTGSGEYESLVIDGILILDC